MGVAFGKYHLIATLGQGGTADVCLAAMRGPMAFRKLVVIKKLRAEVARDSASVNTLLDEARLAARLEHPCVVKTFEVGVHEGEHYLAMEYLDGQSLAHIIRAVQRPPTGFVVRVMGDALAGLHYAHELTDYDGRPLGIVHRDVSPQNLFVTYAGEVKVVDFGIAKFNARRFDETVAGTVKGKLAYMAPEQINQETLDRRTDVFAAGVVFWELLTGRRLFKMDSEGATITKVLFHPIEPPSAIVPGTARELDDICMRALERAPERRWQSAGEMREAIYAYMERGGGMRRDDAGNYVAALFQSERAAVKARISAFMASTEGAEASLDTLAVSPHGSSPPPRSHPPPPEGATSRLDATRLDGPAPDVTRTLLARTDPPRPIAPILEAGLQVSTPPDAARRPWSRASAVATAVLLLVAGGLVVHLARGLRAKVFDASPSSGATSTPAKNVALPPAPPALVLGGSGTIGVSAAPSLVEGFFKKRGATSVERMPGDRPDDTVVVATAASGAVERIVIASDGTNRGFSCLAEQTCDVAMAAREILPSEATELAGRGVGDMRSPASEHVIALDGVALVVHPNNPLRSLERAQLASIFTGDARDWSAVGGGRGPITIIAHEEGAGTVDVLRAELLGGREIAESARRLPDNARIADEVARTPNAIGFVGLAFVKSTKPLAVSGGGSTPLLPTAFTVTTEAYALSRRLYLYTPSRPKPLALELVDYASSPEGQRLIRGAGFIDLDVTLKNAEPCERCPARYATLTKRARRLSLDLRFRPGTHELDTRAARDVVRVVTFLRDHPSAKLLLFGFVEPTRDPRVDQKRSRELAHIAAAELAARGVRATAVEGFGGEMPLASSDGEATRTKNRRVEIWIQSDRP